MRLTKEQEIALSQLMEYRKTPLFSAPKRKEILLLRLSGCAGSGKTYTSTALVEELQKDFPQGISACAPTHQGKNQLKKRGWECARTAHSHLGLRVSESEAGTELLSTGHASVISNRGILLIDEAGMLTSKVIEELVDRIASAAAGFSFLGFNLAIVLLYDVNQLKPVGESVFPILQMGKNLERKGMTVREFDAHLDRPIRFLGTPSEPAINMVLESVRSPEFPDIASLREFNSPNQAGEEYFYTLPNANAIELAIQGFKHGWNHGLLHNYQAITYTHRARRSLNKVIRAGMGFTEDFLVGEILTCISPIQDSSGGIVAPTHTRLAIWSVGEEREFTDSGITIRYRELTTVETADGNYFYGAGKTIVNAVCPDYLPAWNKLLKNSEGMVKAGQRSWFAHANVKARIDAVEHSYACTAYATQGETIPYVFVPVGDFKRFENRGIYTAASRVSKGLCFGI